MLPDAINLNNRVEKNKKLGFVPNAQTVKNFSQLDKGSVFNNLNFKDLANTQSITATVKSNQPKETNIINVDFNKHKNVKASPVDVPTFVGTAEEITTMKKKPKRGFFEKMWDKHNYHIIGSLDANPAGKFIKIGVGFLAFGGIRKIAGPFFKDTAQATEAATKVGYKKISETIHGQAIYKKGRMYITPDVDSHHGGAWKMADSIKNLGAKATRTGTFDVNLKVKVGK